MDGLPIFIDASEVRRNTFCPDKTAQKRLDHILQREKKIIRER